MRGTLAGAAAAGVWAAAEPSARRVFGTEFGDVRLLGRLFARGPASTPIGLGLHLVNGALFGAAFERLGGRGRRQAVAVAQLENLALWPALAVVDRVHPDRRKAVLPRLLTNRRVFAPEVTLHLLFGLVLGTLVRGAKR
jgi:hypothetical protein